MSPPALTERFELRLDQAIIEDVDSWRARQQDMPSRAEAIRRLVQEGLGVSASAPLRFSKGETLILQMLCEQSKALKLKTEIDPEFVQQSLWGGHLWGLEWQYTGVFHSHIDSPAVVSEVVDILDMWDIIESCYGKLTRKSKERIAKEAEPFGEQVSFHGFDGNNEAEHIGVARFLIDDMERFSRFKGRDLNAHMPLLESYRRMLKSFLPIRSTLIGGSITESQIIDILKARTHPSRR